MAEKINQECKLYGTELCSFVGCDGCEKCVFGAGQIKGLDEQEQAARWRATLELIPEEIDALHDTETCAFCGEESKSCYAELSLGHNEPEYKKGWILGMGKKVRCEIGSMIEVPIACCKTCKKMIRLQDILQYVIVIGFFAIGIALMMIPAVTKILEVSMLFPMLLLAAFLIGGYFISIACVKAYVKKQQKKRHINAMEIPTIKKMQNMGWFPVPVSKNPNPHLHFAKNKIRKNFRYFSK